LRICAVNFANKHLLKHKAPIAVTFLYHNKSFHFQ
jgi:hypothetical protein